jgi:hypothetical protein
MVPKYLKYSTFSGCFLCTIKRDVTHRLGEAFFTSKTSDGFTIHARHFIHAHKESTAFPAPISTKHENFQWHFTNIETMNVRSTDRNSFPTLHKVRFSLRWFSWNSQSPNRFLNTRGLRVRTLNTNNYEKHNSKKNRNINHIEFSMSRGRKEKYFPNW